MTTLICPNCGTSTTFNHYAIPHREVIAPQKRRFWNEGKIEEAMMIAYDTTFYEITSGKYKGNLVHTSNVIDK